MEKIQNNKIIYKIRVHNYYQSLQIASIYLFKEIMIKQHQATKTQHDMMTNNQKYVLYPYQLVQTDKKLEQAQRLLLKIIQESYEKQIRDRGDMQWVDQQKKNNQHQGRYVYSQLKQEELVKRNLSYIDQCRIFYQTKLAQQRNRYKQIIAENLQRMRNLGEQLVTKQQQVEKYERLQNLNKQQLRRVHKQSQEIKNKRSMQKQRITQMFIKQKEQLFNKYSNIQRQSMVLLEFLNKIEDITQRNRDDQLNKLAFIQQIQLEATNYYSNLSIPLIQQILNTFTHNFNELCNKFQKVGRNDSKSRNKDHSNQKPNKISLKKLKQYKNQSQNSSYQSQAQSQSHSQELLSLKQKLASIQNKMEEDRKQLQNIIEFERQNCGNLRKKIQKYEIQIRKNNKEIEYHYERQEDLKKKINRLQEQIFDYKSKVKIQDEEIEVYENSKGQSLPNIVIQSQRQTKVVKQQVSKQQKQSQTIAYQENQTQVTKLKQEIQNITTIMKDKLEQKSLEVQNNHKCIREMDNQNGITLRQKQQQSANNNKIMSVKQTEIMWLEQKLRKLNSQLITKSNQIQVNRLTITSLQQQLKAAQQECVHKQEQKVSLNNIIASLEINKYEVEQLSVELNTKCEAIRALQQKVQQNRQIEDRYQKELIRDSQQESMKDKQIAKLRDELLKLSKQNKGNKQSHRQKQMEKQKQKRSEELLKELKQSQENTTSLQKQVFELITKLEQKTKGYNHFKAQNEKCQKQIIHLQNKYKALKQKYSTYSILQKQLNVRNTAQYIHRQMQTDTIETQVRQEINKLSNKIEQLEQIIEENRRTIQRDNIILLQNQEQLQKKQKQLQILQLQLVRKQEQMQQMHEQVTKSKEEQNRNRNIHILEIEKQLQNKINAMSQQSRTFQHKYQQAANQLKQNKTVLATKVQECLGLQTEVVRLGQVLNIKTKQNQEMRIKLESLNNNRNIDNKTIEQQMNVNTVSKMESLQNIVQQLNQELRIKQDRLSHLQQQYRIINEVLIKKDEQLRLINQHSWQQKLDKQKKQNQQLRLNNRKMQELITSRQLENNQLKQTISSLYKQRIKTETVSQSVNGNGNKQDNIEKKQELKQQPEQKDKQKPIQNENQNNLNTTEMETSENMISTKQLNIMQQEITNFKEQLNGLLVAIQTKDDTIRQLRKQLVDLSTTLLANKKDSENEHITQQNSTKTAGEQKMSTQISKLTEKLIQRQRQLQKANIKNTKQQILTSKISELQKKLDSEKQFYQNQINKYNIRIIQLQNDLRKQRQQYDSRKRKVFSEEYYSIDPKINIFQSKPKTNEEVSNNFNAAGQNQTQQNKSQDYHSLEDDSHEENKLRTEQQIQLEQKNQNKTQTKIRKQKSQEYQRRKSGLAKLQKLASIERRYDSDQKSKQQKEMRALMAMRSQEQSPIINSSLENKLINNLKNQKQITRHHPISNDDAHHYCPVSQYGLNEMMRNLTEQNRQLKFINEKLTKDLKNLLQFVEILSKRWKNHKEIENNSQAGKMIALEILQQNIKLLQISKVKILQEFNPHDLQNIFDNIIQLVNQTKRWVNIIEKLTTENKKMNLEMILNKNFPKLVKTKTTKYGVGEQHQRRSRSVYSQGNVYRQHHIDMDQSPFQIQQQHPQPQHHIQHLQPNNLHQQTLNNIPVSSLQILFRQNNEMSEISSVKHKSFNSGFLNSKSQIAKMFEKGEKGQKFGIEHRDQKKDNQVKRDVVDEYMIQNQKIEKIDKQKQKIEKQRQKFQKQKFDKNKNNNVSTIQNISSSTNKVYQSRIHSSAWQNSPLMHKTNQLQAKRIHKFEQKSNKAKTDFLIMLYNKLEMTKKQVQNNKKQYTQFIKGLIQKNEANVLAMKAQFSQAMKKIIKNHCVVDSDHTVEKNAGENTGEIFKKATSKGNIPGRISEKDEQMYERLQQMQQKFENKKKQIEEKQKIILQGKEQLKELDKKLKEEKASHQSTKNKYASQATNSNFLKLRIQKLQTDFKNFMTKASSSGVQNFSILKFEAEAQANIFKDETQPLQKGKTFLKGKKIAKAQTLPQKQQNKANLFNTCVNKTFSQEKIQDQSIVQSYTVNNGETFINNTKQRIKESDQKSPKKDTQKGKESIWVNQNFQSQLPLFKRSSSLVYSPQKQEKTEQQYQQLPKRKQKKEEELQLSLVQRIKSQDMRQSKSPPSDVKLLDKNTIKRKKTISQASQKQKVTHYQKQLKQLYVMLTQALQDTPLKWIQTKQKQQQDNKSQKSENQGKRNGQNGNKVKKNSEQQIEQDKSIKYEQQIRKIVKDLNQKLKEYKSDMEKSVKQREQKLKDIFKQIIQTYKISFRTINKIIDKKVNGDNIYINQRLFFKNLFSEIKSLKAQRWSFSDSALYVQEEQETKFETFEDKYKILVDENTRIKKQLQQKSKQCQSLKKQVNNDERKYLSQKSLVSNQNQQNFHDFQNKELFDNTKPSFQLLQQLRKELNLYKKKCQEYEAINSKKKKQNFKVIRKWQ